MDDLTLARRLAEGDDRAAHLLVDRHHAAIYRFLRQMTRRPDDAEDLAQRTILRMLAAASRFDGRSTMRAWGLGIAFREFTKWRRKRPWLPLLADRPASLNAYASIVDAEALLGALQQLPEAEQALFLLHHVEELSIAEVAESLKIPEGTVKSRLHKTRHRLRTLLGEEETQYVPETCRS